MKISKHIHSCLLVEENNTVILIDPGFFSYKEKALDLNTLSKLDYILVTHEHPDHLHLPFLQDLLAKFPDVTIISNRSVSKLLEKENITVSVTGNEFIKLESAPHERILNVDAPENVLIRIFDKLTHPGDSMQYTQSNDVLALPVQAPWGSAVAAADKGAALKPKIIIPIHDWHWRDEIRIEMYKRFETYFSKLGIQFKSPETGQVIDIP